MKENIWPAKHIKGVRFDPTPEQRQWLRENWSKLTTAQLKATTGLTHYLLFRLCREMKLHKDAATTHEHLLAAIPERNKKIRKALKGRPVSDATKAGLQRFWQEVREGKRPNPWDVLRADKERYAKMCANKRKAMQKLTRAEHFRLLCGQKTQTRRFYVLKRYTQSQSNHRRNAFKRGYIVYDFCEENDPDRWNIYYNKETTRSAKFERNLEKDGFHVLDGTNL